MKTDNELINAFRNYVLYADDNSNYSKSRFHSETTIKWMERNTYNKDKLFQAWLWLSNSEMSVRHETVGDYYTTLFRNTQPTKKSIMEVISMCLE